MSSITGAKLTLTVSLTRKEKKRKEREKKNISGKKTCFRGKVRYQLFERMMSAWKLTNLIYLCCPRVWFISYHIISYHIISYHIISYHIISYHIVSYHIISYQTLFQYHSTKQTGIKKTHNIEDMIKRP